MRMFLPLLKVVLNSQFRVSVLKDRYLRRNERLWEPVAAFVFLLVMVPPMFMLVFFYGLLYQGLSLSGQADGMVVLLFVFGQGVVFVFGFPQLLSTLGFSKDAEGFLPLPITGSQLLAARMTGVWLSMLLVTGCIILPGFLVYGSMEGVGLSGFFALVCLWLLLPAAPLAIASIVAMGIMRLFHVKRFAGWGHVLGALSGLAIFILFQLFMRPGVENDHQEWGRRLAEGGIVDSIQSVYPPAAWAVKAITQPVFFDGQLDLVGRCNGVGGGGIVVGGFPLAF